MHYCNTVLWLMVYQRNQSEDTEKYLYKKEIFLRSKLSCFLCVRNIGLWFLLVHLLPEFACISLLFSFNLLSIRNVGYFFFYYCSLVLSTLWFLSLTCFNCWSPGFGFAVFFLLVLGLQLMLCWSSSFPSKSRHHVGLPYCSTTKNNCEIVAIFFFLDLLCFRGKKSNFWKSQIRYTIKELKLQFLMCPWNFLWFFFSIVH